MSGAFGVRHGKIPKVPLTWGRSASPAPTLQAISKPSPVFAGPPALSVAFIAGANREMSSSLRPKPPLAITTAPAAIHSGLVSLLTSTPMTLSFAMTSRRARVRSRWRAPRRAASRERIPIAAAVSIGCPRSTDCPEPGTGALK